VRGVLLGPMETAGYFARLRAGMRQEGVRTTYIDLENHPFAYTEAPAASMAVRVARFAIQRARASSSTHSRTFWNLISFSARSALLVRAIATCDAFVFGSGQTLLGLRELPLLRLLGKRVIVVFFGTDVRPSYLDGIEAGEPNATAQRLREATAVKRKRVRTVERFASAIVSHSPTSQLLSRPFAEWLAIGIPTPHRPDTQGVDPSGRGPLRVLHAPSHARAKGTDVVRSAVERAIADGIGIDYREVQNASNDSVREQLAWCDVVVDQLYSDTPMGVLGSEAAAAGRACIVGSLDWVSILDALPPDAVPPSIRIHPDALEETLREIAAERAVAAEVGSRALAYVRERWSPQAVARRFLALASDSAEAGWFTDPNTIRYRSGAGLSGDRLAEVRAAMSGPDPTSAHSGRVP
jgi:hypothetical protein